MSVSAIITHPQDGFEKSFQIPVATERFFRKYWIPAIDETNADVVLGFNYGVDIYKDDVTKLIKQLEGIKIWAQKNIEGDDLELMLQRIDLLISDLPTAFRREDAVVFVG